MNLLALQYFCEVARTESITQSAENLMISQPSLSRTIIQLEKELGVQLFERIGRHLKLTTTGLHYYAKVSQALELIEDAKREAAENQGQVDKRIRVSLFATSMLLPELVEQFHTIHGDAEFEFSFFSKEWEGIQLSHDSNVIIFSNPYTVEGYQIHQLMQEEICAAVSISSPLANKNSISLSELKDENFAVASKGAVRMILDLYCQKTGFRPHIAYETPDTNSIVSLIACNLAVTLVPSKSWKSILSDKIKLLHIHTPKIERSIYMGVRENGYISRYTKDFIRFAAEFYHNLS